MVAIKIVIDYTTCIEHSLLFYTKTITLVIFRYTVFVPLYAGGQAPFLTGTPAYFVFERTPGGLTTTKSSTIALSACNALICSGVHCNIS